MAIQLPSSWNQVSINQWADVQQIMTNQSLNDIHKINRVLATLTKVHLSEIESLSFKRVSELSDKITWVNNIPDRLIKTFKINDVEYEITSNVYNCSTGQYADLTYFLKKEGYYKYAECAAVMCLPKGEKYDSSKVEDRALIFWEQMTMDILYPLTAFFLNLLSASLPYLENSLKQKTGEIQEMVKEILTELE